MRVNIVVEIGERKDDPSRDDVLLSQGASENGVWDVLYAKYCPTHKTFVLILHPEEIEHMSPTDAVCLQGKLVNSLGAITHKLSLEMQVGDIERQIGEEVELVPLNSLFERLFGHREQRGH